MLTSRYHRKIIRIRAEDSPNVRFALEQVRVGFKPTGEALVPGVLSWELYKARRATWDKIRQCVGLDGMFYEGAQILLYPPDWLNHSEALADKLRGRKRTAKAVGIDPAEGGDSTAMSAVDEFGLIEMVSRKTPDTNDIPGEVIAFGKLHGCPPSNWIFDRGGGGLQAADRLRAMGHRVRSVGFGEKPTLDPRRGVNPTEVRMEIKEDRYSFVNLRAQMFWELSFCVDPNNDLYYPGGFAIPSEYTELRRQMAPIPKKYTPEGQMKMLPKHRRNADDPEECLYDLLGCSPDELDSLALAVHAVLHKKTTPSASAS